MRTVLFDLDGTLLSSGALYAECYQRAFADVLGRPVSFEEMLARRPASERVFLLEWLGPELGDRVHRRVVEVYAERAPDLLGGLYDGVPHMLEALAADGVRMGIVTGKSRAAYEATCRCVPLDRFDVVVVEDDVPAPKPDPSGILRALDALGARPEESVYVGDTPMDVEAADRAGMRAASALWAGHIRDAESLARKLEAHPRRPVWALRSPADLVRRVAEARASLVDLP